MQPTALLIVRIVPLTFATFFHLSNIQKRTKKNCFPSALLLPLSNYKEGSVILGTAGEPGEKSDNSLKPGENEIISSSSTTPVEEASLFTKARKETEPLLAEASEFLPWVGGVLGSRWLWFAAISERDSAKSPAEVKDLLPPAATVGNPRPLVRAKESETGK